MNDIRIYQHGRSSAIDFAVRELKQIGYSFCDEDEYKLATHILLNVPSTPDLPGDSARNAVFIGGNLVLPSSAVSIDLLKDPEYLAENAMITAHCAVKIASNKLTCTINDCNILVIGWGRIGKCLAQLLSQLGCRVTVAARKPADRAILKALGFHSIEIQKINPDVFDIIYNTVPELLITNCVSSCSIIDLASTPGITGPGVIVARGLPGKEAPLSSGRLIAKTIHRILSKECAV